MSGMGPETVKGGARGGGGGGLSLSVGLTPNLRTRPVLDGMFHADGIDMTCLELHPSELFWRQGYGATSLQHLLKATGMGKGSFYAAFGSKAALFETVIDDYQARSSASFEKIFQDEAGVDLHATSTMCQGQM